MHTLHIALHDGFTDDIVTIRVNGREVFRKSHVRTDLRLSRADGVDVQVDSTKALVEVAVDPGELLKSTEVDLSKTPNLAISRVKDIGITFAPQSEAFRYM